MKKITIVLLALFVTSGLVFYGGCKKKADPAKDKALIEAVQNGNLEAVKKALLDGSNINAVSLEGYSKGNTPLMIASLGGKADIAKHLVDAKADVKVKNGDGATALILAASNGYAEIIKMLLGAGASINDKDSMGMTALIIASVNGRADAVRALMESKADKSIKDNRGKTALDYAKDNKKDEIVKLLQ